MLTIYVREFRLLALTEGVCSVSNVGIVKSEPKICELDRSG